MLLGATLAALSDCAALFHRETLEDAVGTWRYEEGGHTSTMTIDSNGTFEVENAPVEFFTIAYDRATQTEMGQWSGMTR